MFFCFDCLGSGGWGIVNRLDYFYDDFLDVVREIFTGVGKVRFLRSKRNVSLFDYKIKLIFNIIGKDRFFICKNNMM